MVASFLPLAATQATKTKTTKATPLTAVAEWALAATLRTDAVAMAAKAAMTLVAAAAAAVDLHLPLTAIRTALEAANTTATLAAAALRSTFTELGPTHLSVVLVDLEPLVMAEQVSTPTATAVMAALAALES